MKFIFITLFSVALFVSCGNPEPANETTMPLVPVANEKVSIIKKDTIPGRIITTGVFHSEEVWSDIEKMQWTGLFKGKNGYYLKQTKIRAVRVNDVVLDEEGQKTGWKLSVPEKDTNILLISSGELTDRKIKHVKLPKEQIFPGDTVSFRYAGVDYKLFATGIKKQESEESDWYVVSDYKLYLSAKLDGKNEKTLLSDHPAFDDNMVTLVFAGDLDGDGIIDIILDDSNHYNVTTPTLYLSAKAVKGQIVKRVASHISVGC